MTTVAHPLLMQVLTLLTLDEDHCCANERQLLAQLRKVPAEAKMVLVYSAAELMPPL